MCVYTKYQPDILGENKKWRLLLLLYKASERNQAVNENSIKKMLLKCEKCIYVMFYSVDCFTKLEQTANAQEHTFLLRLVQTYFIFPIYT